MTTDKREAEIRERAEKTVRDAYGWPKTRQVPAALSSAIASALHAHGTAQRAAGVEAAAKVAERHIYKGGYGVQYPAGIEAEIAAAIRAIRHDDGEGTK